MLPGQAPVVKQQRRRPLRSEVTRRGQFSGRLVRQSPAPRLATSRLESFVSVVTALPSTGASHVGKNSRHLHDSRAAAEDSADAVLLAIYRVGCQIHAADSSISEAMNGAAIGQGGAGRLARSRSPCSAPASLARSTIFGLGIMPYISASIIFQFLGSVWAPLEQLQKEGESGRKKINEYTRYATVVFCIGQSWFYVSYMVEQRLDRSRHFSIRRLSMTFGLAIHSGHDHDRRHHVPDVARRADRRVRHRQRHQLVDHGRHSGPHAGRRSRTAASKRRWNWAAAAASSASKS